MDLIDVKQDPWLLTEDAFKIYAPCMYEPAYEKYLFKMEKMTSDPDISVFACSENQKYIGIIVLKKKSEQDAEIAGIAVKEEFRRCGAGRFLVEESIRCTGVTEVTAETDDDAVQFYIATGFAVEKNIVHYPDGDCVRYMCTRTVL